MKIVKWCASFLRILVAKIRLGNRLKIDWGLKPVYLGRGVRLLVKRGGQMRLGVGAYIDDYSRLQVNNDASLCIGDFVYLNTNCRVAAGESIKIGSHTMLGPNVCVYDHDHVFDENGVRGELSCSPVYIGERCWIAANTLVTRGVEIADKVLVGGGSVVTDSLLESGVYVGVPAILMRSNYGVGVDDAGQSEENQERNLSSQVSKSDLASSDSRMASKEA